MGPIRTSASLLACGLLCAPGRRGEVVVVGQRSIDGLATGPWRGSFLGNYGEPIAARTGYPTMIVPVPGEYDDAPGREISIGFLRRRVRRTRDVRDHDFFRLAVPYLRALDVLAEILGEGRIRAVIGGHSKRAISAYTAAGFPGYVSSLPQNIMKRPTAVRPSRGSRPRAWSPR